MRTLKSFIAEETMFTLIQQYNKDGSMVHEWKTTIKIPESDKKGQQLAIKQIKTYNKVDKDDYFMFVDKKSKQKKMVK